MRSDDFAAALFQRGEEAVLGLAVEIVEDLRHHFMGVALRGARQIRHEFDAQGLFDLVENVLLHRFHAQHALHHFEGELLRQGAEHAGGVLGLDLGQHHRDGLRIFVLQIVGENGFVHVGELVPHGAAGRTADFLHDHADLVGLDEALEQPLGGFVGAHQRAGRGDLRHELDQELFDQARADRAEVGHQLGEFLDLVLVHHRPQLRAMLLAEREQEDRRAFGTRERAQVFLDRDFGCACHFSSIRSPL